MSNIRTHVIHIGVLIAISLTATACEVTAGSNDAAETENQPVAAKPATDQDSADTEPTVDPVVTDQQDETTDQQDETTEEPVPAGPEPDFQPDYAAMEAFGLDFDQMMPAAAACAQAEGVDASYTSVEQFEKNVEAGVGDDFYERLDEVSQVLDNPDSDAVDFQAFDDAMGMLGILYAAGLGADTTDQTTVDIIMSCVFLATAEDMMGDASPFTMPENG